MRTYIFATDFSPNAQNALIYTLAFIKKLKGRLILFHAFDYANPFVEAPAASLPRMNQELETKARDQLDKWQLMVYELDSSILCEKLVLGGPFVKNLLKLAEEENAEAIFMGTKGSSGIKKYLIGSNTASVIEKASCPVYAIPEEAKFTGINSIVFASDYQEENVSMLDKLANIARAFDARIEFLHISNEEVQLDLGVYDWYQKTVEERLADLDVSFRVFNKASIHEGISTYVKLNQPDLVVMGMHKKTWIERILNKSNTKMQAYITLKPLLVFHHGIKERVLP